MYEDNADVHVICQRGFVRVLRQNYIGSFWATSLPGVRNVGRFRTRNQVTLVFTVNLSGLVRSLVVGLACVIGPET